MHNTFRNHLVSALVFIGCSAPLQADTRGELICKVDSSRDYFQIYPEQRIYASEDFEYYQLMGGLTVLIVNTKTLSFNRLSNLNLLPHSTLDPNQSAEEMQVFSGVCEIRNPEHP